MTRACEKNSTMVIMKNNNTDIMSPNWPTPYPANSNCTWHVIGDPGVRIQLKLKGHLLNERYVCILILFLKKIAVTCCDLNILMRKVDE